MKTIAVASMGGGTGKSCIAAVLGKLMKEPMLMDLSCSAAGLRTYAGGEPLQIMEHARGLRAEIEPSLCTRCGECIRACPLNAISEAIVVDPCRCDGCGRCREVCVPGAIELRANVAGRFYYAETDIGLMLDTDLEGAYCEDPGMIGRVFAEGQRKAADRGCALVLVDMPAGIDEMTLPVMRQCDLVLVVTEPTAAEARVLSGGLQRLREEGIGVLTCLNRADLNRDKAMVMLDLVMSCGVRNAGKIPFHPELPGAVEVAMQDRVKFAGLIPLELRKDYVKLFHTVQFFLEHK